MKKAFHAVLILLALLPPCVNAGRLVPLPQDAKAGQLKGHEWPTVKIDATTYRAAPGAVIFDAYNRTMLPPYLPQSAKVYYRIDTGGQLSKIWLMTPEEEAASQK